MTEELRLDVDAARPAKKKQPQAGPAAAIRLEGVTKRFGPRPAVDNVSLVIEAGTAYGLIGPNGAGKTTAFSMMAGYLRPSQGSLEILGVPPSRIADLRPRVGILPQDALLPASDRVGDFLVHMARLSGIAASRARAAAGAVVEEVGAKDFWHLRCGQLSHGMAKRVALAQALVGDPELLLLDEPTAGLDPRVAYEIRQLMKRRKGHATLVVSSHNLHELEEICDAAAILDRGRLVAWGTMSELTAASEEVHVKLAAGPVPLEAVRALPMLKRADYSEREHDLIVYFDPAVADAETVIAHVLSVLLHHQARISGVSKGRGLEQRVLALT
jgi:ABC-2 type transport system ATP-binding protein